MADIVRARIAPTPSGFLHSGNAYNFLLTEAIVRKSGGQLRLRIDDLDAPRVRPEYVKDIFESLAWLGIAPDSGPRNAAEQEQLFSQRLRLPAYNAMLEQLVATGFVFACQCSRKDLQRHNDHGQYAGTCLHKSIPLNTPNAAWRIQTPEASAITHFNDRILGPQQIKLWQVQRHFIIRRRDGIPAYHVASLCDDLAYGINTIVRGEDLLASTGAQLFLATLLHLKSFSEAVFYHHPLVKDNNGDKLSKTAGSTSLKALRQKGLPAEELRLAAKQWYAPLLQRG